MSVKETRATLQACGFTDSGHSVKVQNFTMRTVVAIPRLVGTKKFYMYHPGKWPLSKLAWDTPDMKLKPKDVREYLEMLIGAAETIGFKAKDVGPGLLLYMSQLPILNATRGRIPPQHSFEDCLRIAKHSPAFLPILTELFAYGLSLEVIESILRGEQSKTLMIQLYAPQLSPL